MKKYLQISILCLIILNASICYSKSTQWDLDVGHSNFFFSVDHIFSKVQGYFSKYKGEITFDPQNFSDSTLVFEIEVGSITTGITKRDKHLLSGDFFDQSKFSMMRFASKKIVPTGDKTFDAQGTFTVKGKDYPLTLPFTYDGVKDHPFKKGSQVAGLSSTINIDRLNYGVGTGKFYDYGVVGKDVEIFISLEVLSKK